MSTSLEAKHQTVLKLTETFEAVKSEHKATQDALTSKEELLQTLLTGLSSNNTNGGGYMGQLAEAKAQLAHAEAEEEQIRVKLSIAEKQLKAAENKWKEVEKEAGDGKRNLDAIKREVDALRKRVDSCGWSAEREAQSEAALKEAKNIVMSLSGVCHILIGLYPIRRRSIISSETRCCQAKSFGDRLQLYTSVAKL